MAKQPITIIDEKEFRGLVAPASVISRRLLIDLLDLIQLSTPGEIKETKNALRGIRKKKSWTTITQVAIEARRKK